MTNDRQTELLHREVDGLITPGESAELSDLADADPAIHHARRGLRELVRTLDRVPAVEPPASFCRDVLDALPTRPGARHPGFSTVLREAFLGWRFPVYAGGAVALLALAFFAGDFMKPVTSVDSTAELTGTLAPGHPAAALPSSTTQVRQAGLNGSLRLARAADGCELSIDVVADRPFDLLLTYNPEALTVLGRAAVTPGRLTLSGTGGQAFVQTVRLREIEENVDMTVHFEFVDSEATLQEGSLTLGRHGDS